MGGVLIAQPDDVQVVAARRDLLSRGILVDYRPNAGIRIAPHFYSTDGEIEVAVGAVDDSLQTGRWREFATRASAVT